MQIERGPRYSWVTVRDDGCGFDNKKVSTSSSGLGLRLINSLVRSSLHGEIFTDSEHGGTRVRFSFRNQEEPSQVTVHGQAFSELKMPYDTVVVTDFADLECEASAKSVAVCATREQ